jgi:hypothetical protein
MKAKVLALLIITVLPMKQKPVYVIPPEKITITSNMVMVRPAYEDVCIHTPSRAAWDALKEHRPSGFINMRIKRDMLRMIENWESAVRLCNHPRLRFYFITLTLPGFPQMHEDKVLHRKLLTYFLRDIKRQHNVLNYVWRAERQQKGNIHYHIIVDRCIKAEKVRKIWNHLLDTMGYIEKYRELQKEWHKNGFRVRDYQPEGYKRYWSYEQQKAAYKNNLKDNFSNPWSTSHVQSGKGGMKALANYIAKDVSKTANSKELYELKKKYYAGGMSQDDYEKERDRLIYDPAKKINARVWGHSLKLSKTQPYKAYMNDEKFHRILIGSLEQKKDTLVKRLDYCTIFYSAQIPQVLKLFPKLTRSYYTNVFKNFTLLYPEYSNWLFENNEMAGQMV